MSLLSTDITKVKRLSLKEVKLPTPERRVEPVTPVEKPTPLWSLEPITPTLLGRPPTNEEIKYSKLLAINPIIEKLVYSLGLVSIETGERINKVELSKEPPP